MGKFKVGDKVKVRKWEDMVKEFGLRSPNTINVPYGFTDTMRRFCGNVYTIKDYIDMGYGGYCLQDVGGFNFTDEMLEKAEETFDRDTALRYLLDGKKVSNTGWIKDIYMAYQPDDRAAFVVVNVTDGKSCNNATYAFEPKNNWYLYEEHKAKEMTLEDISKALGFDVKIVKGYRC